jgi:glutathione S-transferase
MSLTLYYHPLSSFCHKALIALYETGAPFTPRQVNLQDPADKAAFQKIWPIGKFPVLRDDAKDRTLPESTIIIEYLAQHYPGKTALIPADPDRATQTRLQDRIFDLYVHLPMQDIVGDRLRPAEQKSPTNVTQARARLETAYRMIDADMAGKTWAMGEDFTLADCAASPALFYANKVMPFVGTHKALAAYYERLIARPSYARTLKEAEPYFQFFPKE